MKSGPTKKPAASKKRAGGEEEEKAAKSAPAKKAKNRGSAGNTIQRLGREVQGCGNIRQRRWKRSYRGSISDDEEEDEEEQGEERKEKEEEGKEKDLTQERMDRVRVVIMTPCDMHC
jgi:hypothetical protein